MRRPVAGSRGMRRKPVDLRGGEGKVHKSFENVKMEPIGEASRIEGVTPVKKEKYLGYRDNGCIGVPWRVGVRAAACNG